jgi:small-conductance mechanosensitive channel
LTQVSIVAAAALIAAEQLGLDVSLLKNVLLIVMSAALGAAALAFGLGAREVVSDILAMHYVNKSYRIGQVVRIGSQQGRIVRTTRTSVLLENAEGELAIPGRRFANDPCVLLNEEVDRGA